jgi:hypothetical protein
MTAPAQKPEYQSDLFTKRFRKVPRRDPLEYKMQIALVDLLKLTLRPDRVAYWHTPNGEWRSIQTGAKLKAMGVLPGVADLFFLWSIPVSVVAEPHVRKFPQNLFLELKRRGQDLSPEQEHFRDLVTAHAAYYELADSVDDAIAILKRYHILRSTTQGISA